MRKLVINGSVADLSADSIIALSKEINDIWDLKDKRSNLSNTFTLPYSQANNILFSNANDLTITNLDFRNYYEVQYIQDYVQIISYGKGKLVAASADGYQFVIYWGNIDIAETLGDKTLQDLDLADLNHVWNHDNVRALYVPGTAPFEVLYPFFNPTAKDNNLFNTGTAADPMFSAWFIPFVSLRRLLLQIAFDNGLDFFGGIENVNTMAYVPVAFNVFRPEYKLEASFNARDTTNTANYDTLLVINTGNSIYFNYDKIIVDGSTGMASGLFTVPETGTYVISLAASVYWQMVFIAATSMPTMTVSHFFELNSLTFGVIDTMQGADQTLTDFVSGVFNFDNYTRKINLTAGDVINVDVTVTFSGYPFVASILSYHMPQTLFTIDGDVMNFGSTWSIARNLPDIKQIDLLKYVCLLGGYIFEKKENSNQVTFTKLDDIITSTDVQDLSEYLERFEINDFHSPLSQSNRLKYKNDDTVKETLGDGFILIDDNTLTKEETIYEAPFGATEVENFVTPTANTLLIARIPFLKEDLTWLKVAPRICHCRLATIDTYYRQLSNTNLVASKFVAQFTTSDLVLSQSVNSNYQSYTETVNDYKSASAWCYLTSAQFMSIDLTRPAYFKQLGGKFLIQKVNNFVKGQLTEIQLIKI